MRAATVVLGLAVLAGLSGCVHTDPMVMVTPASHKSPTASAPTSSPTPSPSVSAGLPANALLKITATVSASNGAAADLTQIVYAPAPLSAADSALLDAQCNYPGIPDFQGQPTCESSFPSPLGVTTPITSTLHAGSPAFSTEDGILFFFLGPSAYSGSYLGFEAYCSPGLVVAPGTIHGVAPVPSSDPIGGNFGWASANGYYGFTGGGNAPGGPDLGGTAVVTNCTIQASAAAKAAAASVVNGWLARAVDPTQGCVWAGPQG